MRKPPSPLRRVLAVVLSLLILPWQQPALALADPPSPGVGAAFNPEKPREVLDALDRKLDVLVARIKSNALKTPELTAALPEDLVKLKGEYKAALDKYIEAEKTAIEPAKSALTPLIAASTGQILVEAIVESDLGGIRKELAALVTLKVSFQRPPGEIPAGDWAAIEKAAPDFQSALGPLSFRIEKARMKDRFAVAEVEDGYRPLALALNTAFLDLRASAQGIDVKGLLAAKPQTISGDAAGALMAEVARALPKDKAALLKPQLAAVNARLAGYLHSGNPDDLTSARVEIDRLFDAADIKDKDKRAALFDHIGKAAQTQAQEAVAPKGTPPGFTFSEVAKKPGIDSTEVPLEVAASAPKPDVKSALAAWVAEGQAAAGPAWDALRQLIPETADPAIFMRNYALNGLAELSRGRAAELKTESANEKAAKALTDAYELIEKKVTSVVMDSPERSKDPAPAGAGAFAEYEKKWAARSAAVLAELKKLEAEFEVVRKAELGVTGAGIWGWSEAVFAKSPALVSEADAKTLVAPRARAKTLVDLVRSLRAQHEKETLDLTKFTEEGRRNLLYGDGKGATDKLGATGQAVVKLADTERDNLKKAEAVLARFKDTVQLTGNRAADMATLDQFFDGDDAKAAAAAGILPPMLADWSNARAYERESAKLRAEGKPPLPRPAGLPGVEESYSRFIVAARYDRVKEIGNPTEKQMGELHETYFAMNRAAYIALGCDQTKLAAAENVRASTGAQVFHRAMAMAESISAMRVPSDAVPGTEEELDGPVADEPSAVPAEEAAPEKFDRKKTAAFCAGFLAHARRPTAYNQIQFNAQKKLADEIKAYLNDNDLARASTKSAKATETMLRHMRAMTPELREEYARRGVDIDGILRRNDQAQELQWAAVVRQLNTAGDDAGWQAYRDSLIVRMRGDKTALATKVQADKLRAAATSSDAAGLTASLGDIQNPGLLTSGYLAALPKMLASARTPRSARDRSLTAAWNGGAKKGETPPEMSYAGRLLNWAGLYDTAAAKPENQANAEEFKRLAALMREVAANPSDAEKTAEALRAAHEMVLDARAVRVGLDSTKVGAEPKTEEERRDFLTAVSLARQFLGEGETFRTAAGAEKIRRGLLGKLGGPIADAQEQNRKDQLILSAGDQERDIKAKAYDVSLEMLGDGAASAAATIGSLSPKAIAALMRRSVEGGASYLELARMASALKGEQDASLELYNLTDKLSATAWGRASMTLPGLVASVKAGSRVALRGDASPDGLTLSGWMVGLPAGDVTRRRHHQTPVAERPKLSETQEAIVAKYGNPNAPKGELPSRQRDGFSYVQGDGSTIFRALRGNYSETTARKFETVTVGGVQVKAAVSMGFNSLGEPVSIYTEGGKSFVVERKGDHDAKGENQETSTRREVTGVSGIAPVQTVQVITVENGRQAVSLIERRQTGGAGETLNWTRYYTPKTKGASYDSVGMDLVAHTQSVTIDNHRTTFDLTKDNVQLDPSRRRSTYDVAGGGQRLLQTEYVVRDPDTGRAIKAVVEQPRTGFEGASVTEIRDYRLSVDTGDDNKRDGWGKPVHPNLIGRLTDDAVDRAIAGNKIVVDTRADDRGSPRVDFRVTLDRKGKTDAQLGQAYRDIGQRLGVEMDLHKDDSDRTSRAEDFSKKFERLASFFDNQFVTDKSAYAVNASISRGGTVSMSGMRFDAARMRDASVDSAQYTYVSLPEIKESSFYFWTKDKEASKRQSGLPEKEQNGVLLSQELWAVAKVARSGDGDETAFVVIKPGGKDDRDRVTGYFGNYNKVEGHHDFRAEEYNEKRTDGEGHWYHGADIIRNFYIDNSVTPAGKIISDETTSMWNGGGKLGAYTNNSIRYSDWGRDNPKTAAFVGGVTGGAIQTLLDPVMLGMMVIPMGAGFIAAKIGTGAFRTFKLIETGVNAYFMASIVVSTGEGVVNVAIGVYKDDANLINEGGMAVGAAVAMGLQMGVSHLLAGKGAPKEPGGEPAKGGVEGKGEGPAKEGRKGDTGAEGEVGAKGGTTEGAKGATTEGGKGATTEGGKGATTEGGKGATTEGGKGAATEGGKGAATEGGKGATSEGGKGGTSEGGGKDNGGGKGEKPATTPPPTPHTGGMPRLAETPGFKGSNLDAPAASSMGGSSGGGGGELAPGGTKSSANSGAGGGGSSSAPKPMEAAAAAKPMETAAAKPAETASKAAPAEAAKAPTAPESAPAKNQAREAAPENQIESASQLIAQGPHPMEPAGARGASAGEASMGVGESAGVGRGRSLVEGGPLERGPAETAREPAAEGGPIERAGGPKERIEARTRTEPSRHEGPAVEPTKGEASFSEPVVEKTGRPTETQTGSARHEASHPTENPGSNRGEAEVQREANALIGEGSAPAPAPQAKPGIVRSALNGGDALAGWVLKPVGRLWDAAAARVVRAGEWKMPFTETPMSSIVGNTARGLQTVGIGVEAFGSRLSFKAFGVQFNFLGSPVRGIGMMLQGRVLPHEGRPLSFEEVWHPDLAKRPSFLEAASPDVLAKGGTVEGLFDPATGRASFGPKAKGSVEVSVEVRPNGKGGVEVTGYQVKSADAKLEAQAHGEMFGQLERTFRTELHQAKLDSFFENKDVRAKLGANGKLTGETFVDVVYDASARGFRLAEPGRGEARLRFEPEPSGQLRLVEAEPLREGGRLPPSADYNLRMFSARRGVSLTEGALAAPKLSLEERGARYAERVKAERVRAAEDSIARAELADARFKDAEGRLIEATTGGRLSDNPALDKVREHARVVAELRIERELANAEITAADKHLDKLAVPKEALARAEAALAAREQAGRALDKPDAGLDAARRFRIADENAARIGGELTESGVDALVQRQAANQKLAALEAGSRLAQRRLKMAVAEARGGTESPAVRKAAIREVVALEQFVAAKVAQTRDGAISEYRRDGLHRSTGGDGRRVKMMRQLAQAGQLESGRAVVGQEAGQNLCVLATAADMAAAKTGRPAEGAMREAEAAIIKHHQAIELNAKNENWEVEGRAKGEAFIKEVAKSGMTGPEMRVMMGAVAEASGLKLVEIPAEKLFVELAAGRQIAVVMTHVGDAVAGIGGGAHMVNLSNWREARNALTGRVETMVDVADPNVRVLVGKDASGAPVYEARTVAMPLSEIVPELRGSLRGENGPAAGYAFEPAGGAGTRGPPSLTSAELVDRMGGSEGVGVAPAVVGVKAPAGFESRGRGKVIDPTLLPVEIYSKEIVEVAREHGLVYELSPTTLSRMKPGVKHNFVIVESPNGLIEMTVGRLAEGNVKEVGVKHVALGDGRPVLFSGEVMRDPATGRPKLDFNSGMYSQIGLDPRWAPTRANAEALAAHAEAILGTRVEIFDHFEGRPIETRSAAREGVGSAPDAAHYNRYFSVAEIRAAHPEPASGGVYHDWQHTVKVADMAGEFAKARGLKPSDAKFVSEVALLHDFDPTRAPGMPARVPATIAALRADFAGTRSLTGEPGRSVLKERFGWSERQLKMAEAIIQRTEFPFGDKHPSPAYAEKSPLTHYEEMLQGMKPADRAFVLREAPLLSEYADKSSWYATENFTGAFKVVEGLASEINRSIGKEAMSVQNLGTNGFLKVIGEPASFTHDRALAEKFGVKLELMNRAEAFKVLPEQYGRTFEANLKGFGEFDVATKAGDAAAFEKGRAIAEVAQRPVAPLEGVGAAFESPRSIVRHGQTRGEGWVVDGVAAERLSGGAFKEVLVHPKNPNLVIKLFSEIGAKDTAGSLSEKRREVRNMQPLLDIGRTPRVVEAGALELQTPSSGGKKITGYIVQERVVGREVGDLLRDPSLEVRNSTLKEIRVLFDELITARIKLEDRVKMHENISIGQAGNAGAKKAWVLDAGEVSIVAKPGMMDGLRGKPDALRAYYETVFADLSKIARGASPARPGRVEGVGSALEPMPDSPVAARLRGEQNFARTPDYPNSPVFTENSRKANDLFNRWLNGQEGGVPLRQAMENMHRLYAGQGEIGKGMGGQYASVGQPSNGRAKVTRDFVQNYYGLEPARDGHVELPGIPREMTPVFLGTRYFYPDSSIPGMHDAYYKALETHLGKFSEQVNKIEARKSADARFEGSAEHQAMVTASLDTVVDFGRTAAAFRQFKNGNWGLYGPMVNSMVNRLGFSIKSPGYLDIILQGATEASVKPFFAKAVREGRDFFPKDGYDPTTGKKRVAEGAAVLPEVRAEAVPARPRDIPANAPAVVKYEGPIRLRIGGEFGKTLEIMSRADLGKRFPAVERSLVDPRIEHVLIDPSDPSQIKGLRSGQTFELGRASPGRFDLMQQVSSKHLRITGNGATLTIEDLGSRNGTRIEAATAPEIVKPAFARPAMLPLDGTARIQFGGKTVEVLTRAELASRFPEVAKGMMPGLTHFIIDPLKPGEFKALRPEVAVELGSENPGRFKFGPEVAPKHARVTLRENGVFIEDLGGGLRIDRPAEAPSSRVEGVGSGSDGGILGRLFGSREKTPVVPEKIVWPVESGGPTPAQLDFTALKLDGALRNLEPAHTNVLAVELGGRKAVLKLDAKPNEARVLAAMAEVPLPANVRIPRLLGDAPADAMALHRLAEGGAGIIDYSVVKRAAAEGRHMIAVERLPDDFVSMMQVTNGSVKLKEPISTRDWQGLLDAVKALARRDMAFGDLGNQTNIRLRQVADGKGGVRTEFALIDTGQGTFKGKMEAIGSDYVQLKGDRALETMLVEKKLLEGRGKLPDPRLAAMARNQVPQTQKLAEELNALMKDGGGERPAAAARGEGQYFTSLAEAAAYLNAPGGMHLLAKTSEGLAGDTVKVEIGGEEWYAKRVTKKLGETIDEGLRGLTPRERAGNELMMRALVHELFPESFRVAPEAIVIEHGGEIFVMTKAAKGAPAPERLQSMSATTIADYSVSRLGLRIEDVNKGNIIHAEEGAHVIGKDALPALIDMEKVITKPLDPARVAREAENELLVKSFPVVSMKGNDPALYSARADRVRAKFADPVFVAKVETLGERYHWTPERTAEFLQSTKTNLANYETNLKPYLEVAKRVAAKRAEGVGSAHEEVPGFVKKSAIEPRLEPELPVLQAPAVTLPMTDSRLTAHVMAFEMTPLEHGQRYVPREIRGGGHTEKGLEQAIRLASESLERKRAQYETDQQDLLAAQKRHDVRMVNKLTRTINNGGELPAKGTHWTERPESIVRLEDYPNGVKRVVLPEQAYTADAWETMGPMTKWIPGYVQGGKTFFPAEWTAHDIRLATSEVALNGKPENQGTKGKIMRGKVTLNGRTVSLDVSIDASGRTSTSYPSWNQ